MELVELFSIASLRVLRLGEHAQLDKHCKAGLGQTILVRMDARTLFLLKTNACESLATLCRQQLPLGGSVRCLG
jgi:hypothetical protein